MTSTAATHSGAVRVLCSVLIIARSYTRNIEYLISWLQKIRLELLLFECSSFSEPLVFKDMYFLERSSLFKF